MLSIKKVYLAPEGSQSPYRGFLCNRGIRISINPEKGLYEANRGLSCKPVYISGELRGFSVPVKLSKADQYIYERSEDGRAYLEYNRQIGGDPLGFTVGMPVIDIKSYGGIAGIYRECISRGVTWEELLQWSGVADELGGVENEIYVQG